MLSMTISRLDPNALLIRERSEANGIREAIGKAAVVVEVPLHDALHSEIVVSNREVGFHVVWESNVVFHTILDQVGFLGHISTHCFAHNPS